MYTGTENVVFLLGGTNTRFSIGTAGSCSLVGTLIDHAIWKADILIDVKTTPLYGTQHFGTNANGTRGLPDLIKSVSEDLAAYYTIRGMPKNLRSELMDLGESLYKSGMNLLDSIADGSIQISDYQLGDTGQPQTTDLFVDIIGEVITMDGTDTIDLDNQKVKKFSERVTGTAIDGTFLYIRDTDYKIYYWDDKASGTWAGYIRRMGGGSITDGQDVKIDYTYWKDHPLYEQGKRIYGQGDAKEL